VLKLTDVRKSYGSTVAVDGLSLEMRAGEVFGLLGPNGAGKSTTRDLARLHPRADGAAVRRAARPRAGDVRVRDRMMKWTQAQG
jgi:ABC-2 type transport system ATP-binding protein